MANPLAIIPHASGAETVSGQSAAVDVGALRTAVRLLLDVTDLTGTLPTLIITIETSPTGTAGWRAIGQFDTVASSTNARRTFAQCERFVRAAWTITGSAGPTITFAVTGEAHVLYATPDDITRTALPPEALTSVPAYVQADASLAATDEADGYIAGGYVLPLTAWSEDLRTHVAAMAAYAILKRRGFDPSGRDQLIVDGRKNAIDWLKMIATGKLKPPGMADSTPEIFEAGGYVYSRIARGW